MPSRSSEVGSPKKIKNKQRLYVAVSALPTTKSGAADASAYQWALVLGPKSSKEHRSSLDRYWTEEPSWQTWLSRGDKLSVTSTTNPKPTMVRLAVTKIPDPGRLQPAIESVSLGGESHVWAERALLRLDLDYDYPAWSDIQRVALDHCRNEAAVKLRVDSQKPNVPTYNLIKDHGKLPVRSTGSRGGADFSSGSLGFGMAMGSSSGGYSGGGHGGHSGGMSGCHSGGMSGGHGGGMSGHCGGGMSGGHGGSIGGC